MSNAPTTSNTYKTVKQAAILAEDAFKTVALDEIVRLIPEGVTALVFSLNDTPRLTFDGFRVEGDHPDEEREAEEIDDYIGTDTLYDTLDEIAMELGFRDFEDADNWLLRLKPDSDECRWIVTPNGESL